MLHSKRDAAAIQLGDQTAGARSDDQISWSIREDSVWYEVGRRRPAQFYRYLSGWRTPCGLVSRSNAIIGCKTTPMSWRASGVDPNSVAPMYQQNPSGFGEFVDHLGMAALRSD